MQSDIPNKMARGNGSDAGDAMLLRPEGGISNPTTEYLEEYGDSMKNGGVEGCGYLEEYGDSVGDSDLEGYGL